SATRAADDGRSRPSGSSSSRSGSERSWRGRSRLTERIGRGDSAGQGLGALAVPGPGGLDGRAEGAGPRLPGYLAVEFGDVSAERGRVAGPPGHDRLGERVAGDPATDLDDLAYRVAAAGPDVEGVALPPVEQRAERVDVGAGEVDDVDVVADRRAVP